MFVKKVKNMKTGNIWAKCPDSPCFAEQRVQGSPETRDKERKSKGLERGASPVAPCCMMQQRWVQIRS